MHASDEDIRDQLRCMAPSMSHEIEKMEFWSIKQLVSVSSIPVLVFYPGAETIPGSMEQSVKDDVNIIRIFPLPQSF